MSRERPWEGRRLHMIGVGGAGMSGYARAAHALGAQVSGSDRSVSPYSERLREEGVLDAAVGHRGANVPSGDDVEVIYSSAVPADNAERVAARERGLPERPRAALLGELTAMRRTIAVAGAHGKSTTSAMIAWVMREAGWDPSWLVGAPVGEGLDNSHWGSGEWLVVEADESDRSMLSVQVEIAVLTNVELDHHATFATLEELREAFAQFLARAQRAVVVWERPDLLKLTQGGSVVTYDVRDAQLSNGGSRFAWRGHEVELAVPGLHNALNATAALHAARLAGVDEHALAAAIGSFRGAGRRFQRLGRTRAGALVIDDYAHHPTEVAATLRAARTLDHTRIVAVFQPHLYSRTAMLAQEFGAALANADVSVVLEIYPARERAGDHPGVSGLQIVRAAAERAHGRPVYWLPTFDAAQPVLERLLGEGDVCLAMGAGDVDRLARRLLDGGSARTAAARRRRTVNSRLARERAQVRRVKKAERRGLSGERSARAAPPQGVVADFPLGSIATVRTGGPAELFARVGSETQLAQLLDWARAAGIEVSVVGSGSNLLVADDGVRGLVVKLDRALASIEIDGDSVVCGGGARLPSVAARVAAAGLAGLEFGVNIPGTVGGAVRMNANAYGGQLASVLEWAQVVGPGGAERRTPAELGFAYRSSSLRSDEIVTRARFALERSQPAAVKAVLERMRAQRHEAQPQGIKTFGSTFKNPQDARAGGRTAGMLLAEAGCSGLAVGGARFAPKHANFVQNTGSASTADVVALMAEGRRRVAERFGVELEPEVQTLGPVRFPWE